MSSVFYVEKRGKYLQGSSYTTGLGTKNPWTYSIVNAKVFFLLLTLLRVRPKSLMVEW